jgi:hypothetical protein
MQLTPGVSIERGDIVSRQTIYDLVRLAAIGTVQASDLASGTLTIVSQTLPPNLPQPGLLWWDMEEQLAKVWTDILDGTAVSLWLAIGPDRFDAAVLATEPIPFGAAVEASYGGIRSVQLPPHPTVVNNQGYTAGRFENLRVLGFNQGTTHGSNGTFTAPTAPSGTWLPIGISGIMRTWNPLYLTGGFGFLALNLMGVISMFSGLTGASGMTDIRGGILHDANSGGGGGTVKSKSYLGKCLWNHANASEPAANVMDAWPRCTFFGPVWQ